MNKDFNSDIYDSLVKKNKNNNSAFQGGEIEKEEDSGFSPKNHFVKSNKIIGGIKCLM